MLKRLFFLLLLVLSCLHQQAQSSNQKKPCSLCKAKTTKDYQYIITYNLHQLNNNRNSEPALYDIAQAYSMLKKPDSSVFYMNKLIEKNPRYKYAFSQRGLFKLFLSDTTGACFDFKEAIRNGDDSNIIGQTPISKFVIKYCNGNQ